MRRAHFSQEDPGLDSPVVSIAVKEKALNVNFLSSPVNWPRGHLTISTDLQMMNLVFNLLYLKGLWASHQ